MLRAAFRIADGDGDLEGKVEMSSVRFLKSKVIDDPEAEQYQAKLVRVGPDHWVAEHDAVGGAEALLAD